MQAIEHLEYGETYHVYNAGVQHCRLFRESAGYERFLVDHERYLSPVAFTMVWCLMGNHLHFIITILKEAEIKPFSELPPGNRLKTSPNPTPSVVANPDGGVIDDVGVTRLMSASPPLAEGEVNSHIPPLSGSLTTDRGGPIPFNLRKPKPSTQLSHLFNSYAQYYNKKYQRRGVLFEKGFCRKLVDDPEYLKNLIDYIHNNPVRHRFVDHPREYPWSSYTNVRLHLPKP